MDAYLQEMYQEFMDLYAELKREVKHRNKVLFERWKAGGYIVDDDVLSMYPSLGKVIEELEPEDADEEEEGIIGFNEIE